MTNHLSKEKSPYLRQHSDNPVDWYPWSEEAFEMAVDLDKPVFLSIGYSTCHWCHVMAHESFEDELVSGKLNDSFISIKVDREERPDIDSVYMKAAMLATGRGGWPLSIFMTPEGEPFFAATYIPKTSRFGMMGFIDLIDRIDHLWKNSRDELKDNGKDIVSALKNMNSAGMSKLEKGVLKKAFNGFSRSFDKDNGGFGGSPKFPSPHQLLYLLAYHQRTGDDKALGMVRKTLDNIIKGGIHDHVGGGFHRYSTDERWLVPHFEKMLYDQAMMMMLLSEAFKATGDTFYLKTIEKTYDYLSKDLMKSDEDLFYSAEDADSEGEEGRFYVWTFDEIFGALGEAEGKEFCKFYNIIEEGNFRDDVTGKNNGTNIIHLDRDSPLINQDDRLEILLKTREKRVRPSRDEKVLTDWNALMISALSKCGHAIGRDDMVDKAISVIGSLEKHLKKDGIWFHRYMDGETKIPGMVDDLAFLSHAYIDLYEATFDIVYLEKGLEILDVILNDLEDKENGGLFQTSDGDSRLITRIKEAYDGAYPSGNSIAAWSLIRASRMTGRIEYEEAANRIFQSFSGDILRSQTSFAMMLIAYMQGVGPSREIIISGDIEDPVTREMIDTVRTSHLPLKIVLFKDIGDQGRRLEKIAPFTIENVPINGKPTAYVCSEWKCEVPINNLDDLKVRLTENNP